MGKGGKGGQHHATFQRINFLYQAAQLCLVKSPRNPALCRFYISSLKTIMRRQVLRIHPDMKRTLCKKCDILLLPGVTAKVRTRAKREKHTVVTCMECGNQKTFLWRKNYKPWFQQPEAWLSKQGTDSSGARSEKDNSQKKVEDSQKKVENSQMKVEDSQMKVEDSQMKVEDSQMKVEDSQMKVEDSQMKEKDQSQDKKDME